MAPPHNPESWFKRQWNDVKGNVKYAVLLFVGGIFVTAAITLTHGLSIWQQGILALIFVLLFGWAVAATTARRSFAQQRRASCIQAKRK